MAVAMRQSKVSFTLSLVLIALYITLLTTSQLYLYAYNKTNNQRLINRLATCTSRTDLMKLQSAIVGTISSSSVIVWY